MAYRAKLARRAERSPLDACHSTQNRFPHAEPATQNSHYAMPIMQPRANYPAQNSHPARACGPNVRVLPCCVVRESPLPNTLWHCVFDSFIIRLLACAFARFQHASDSRFDQCASKVYPPAAGRARTISSVWKLLPKNTGVSFLNEYNNACNYSFLRIIESAKHPTFRTADGSSIRLSLRELKGLKDARGPAAQAHSAHRPTP